MSCSFRSRRTRGVKSSARAGNTSNSAGTLKYRVRASHAHTSLFRGFPFFATTRLSEIIRAGDENSYENEAALFMCGGEVIVTKG